ncbi:hypothetical protein V1291_005377 [Nitrobacteraceae bacterium AZCC 1564]
MKAAKKSQPLVRIFAIPIVLNVLAAAGLAAGLFGDGGFDAMSWLLLVLPLIVAVWCFRFRAR